LLVWGDCKEPLEEYHSQHSPLVIFNEQRPQLLLGYLTVMRTSEGSTGSQLRPDGVCTAGFGCFSTGAKGGGFCTTFLAQVRFGTGAKGAGIGAIGFSYGAMEQWALVYAQLV
jgi:hypothetical protein